MLAAVAAPDIRADYDRMGAGVRAGSAAAGTGNGCGAAL